MNLLVRIFGWPHEGLHVLALWLIGRRALAIRQTHVDIPGDLSTGQYVFVAGLPALVFWGLSALGIIGLLNATTLVQAALALVVALFFGVGAVGTLGDVTLIIERLLASQRDE